MSSLGLFLYDNRIDDFRDNILQIIFLDISLVILPTEQVILMGIKTNNLPATSATDIKFQK